MTEVLLGQRKRQTHCLCSAEPQTAKTLLAQRYIRDAKDTAARRYIASDEGTTCAALHRK